MTVTVISSLVLRVPVLTVAIVGLIVALTRASQHRSPAMLAAGGCGLIVVAEIVDLPLAFLPALIAPLHLALSRFYLVSIVLGIFYTLLLAAGVSVLIAAVFAGRTATAGGPTQHPRYPYQTPQPPPGHYQRPPGQYQQPQPGQYQAPQPPPGPYQQPQPPQGPYPPPGRQDD